MMETADASPLALFFLLILIPHGHISAIFTQFYMSTLVPPADINPIPPYKFIFKFLIAKNMSTFSWITGLLESFCESS